MSEPESKKQKTVPFSIMMPDGSMRHMDIPFVENQKVKDAQEVAVAMLNKEDQKVLSKEKDNPRWFYACMKNQETNVSQIIDWMRNMERDSIEFLEVDKETKKPIARYTIKREIL